MRRHGWYIWLAVVLTACLLLTGCETTETAVSEEHGIPIATLEYEPFPDLDNSGETVAVSSRFLSGNGEVLRDGEVRLTVETVCASFPLDEAGEIRVSGLPREGTVGMTIYDGEGRERGNMTLHFSLGAVIDASTDEKGDGYVITRADTEAVALQFTVSEKGMQCVLRLEE